MINVLCLYLVNIRLICFIFYMLYLLVMTGWTPSFERGRGRPCLTKEAWSTLTHPYRTHHFQYTCIHHSRGWLLRPSWSTYSRVCYDTIRIITRSLSLHSCSRLLYLHPHLQKGRPAISLLLCLRLVNLVHRVPRPPCPAFIRLHEPASGA